MAKKIQKTNANDKSTELLQDILILALGKENIPQREIRNIVGVDMHRVNRILKHLKKEYGRK